MSDLLLAPAPVGAPSRFQRALDRIERAGNALPHPATLSVVRRGVRSSTAEAAKLMTNFPLVLMFAQRYDPRVGIGTMTATMLPYSIGFLVSWSLWLIVWVWIGLPVGPRCSPDAGLSARVRQCEILAAHCVFLRHASSGAVMVSLRCLIRPNAAHRNCLRGMSANREDRAAR